MHINSPELWLKNLPRPHPDGHKYDRGHAIVVGGALASTGAARLAAKSALRIGAGLVSIACDSDSLIVYATALQAVMTKVVDDINAYQALISDPRITGILLGPGAGLSSRTREFTLASLATQKPCVLDADALSVFKDDPDTLFKAITAPTLLTPHEGEFERLFGKINDRKTDLTCAVGRANCVILLKGPQTLIAAPNAQMVINQNAPPWLATAGSGDVLAGLALGLIAQGMEAYDAARCATWLHAEAANRFGLGLIASDIEAQIPKVLQSLI